MGELGLPGLLDLLFIKKSALVPNVVFTMVVNLATEAIFMFSKQTTITFCAFNFHSHWKEGVVVIQGTCAPFLK